MRMEKTKRRMRCTSLKMLGMEMANQSRDNDKSDKLINRIPLMLADMIAGIPFHLTSFNF